MPVAPAVQPQEQRVQVNRHTLQALGMTTDELTAAVKDGKTLEQLAKEADVDFADVQAAMQAARDAKMRERIQQAPEEEKITQEHADWLLEGLAKGFLGGSGRFGPGFDGLHGPGPGPAPDSRQRMPGNKSRSDCLAVRQSSTSPAYEQKSR